MKKIFLYALLILALVTPTFATVTGLNDTAQYNCTGSTGPYSFTFAIPDSNSLTVIQTVSGVDTFLNLNSDYTISPVNNNYVNGGSVTLVNSCPSGATLTLLRSIVPYQNNSFTEYMPTLYKTFEGGLDKLTQLVQDLLQRGLTFPLSSSLPTQSNILPPPIANNVIGWNSAGTGGLVDIPLTGIMTSQSPWLSNINANGYTLYGNSTAGGDLYLASTSNVTKGQVRITDPFYIDATNTWTGRNAQVTVSTNVSPTYMASNIYSLALGNGDNTHQYGVMAGYFSAADNSNVPPNKGCLYALAANVICNEVRNKPGIDDVTCLVASNIGTHTGTDAICVEPGNTVSDPTDWIKAFNVDAPVQWGLSINGTVLYYGIDLRGTNTTTATYGIAPIRLPNAGWIVGRNSGDSADQNLIRYNSSNQVEIGNSGSLTVSDGAVLTPTLYISGDSGALGSGYTGLTNVTSTTVTNTYKVNGGQAANTANTGWIKIYIGTNTAWVPYWQNSTP